MRTRGMAQTVRRAARRGLVGLIPVTMALAVAGPAGAWSYKEAARPYAGRSITVLDEVTPLQET